MDNSIVMVKTDNIIPYDRNPRRNTEAVKYVANSIKEFGFKQPIVVDKDNVIIAGHTRWLAAQTLGLEEVPCIVAEDLTDEQVKAYRLADNKVGEMASWDFDLLAEELASLDIDMSEFGFTIEDAEYEEPENEPKERESVDITSAWSLIIDCESEEDMQEKYDLLAEMGISCRTSTL